MRNLFKVVAVVAVAGGLTVGMQAVASAEHGHCGSSGRGYYSSGYGGYQNGGYSASYRSGNYGGIGINYRSSYGPTWHNTSHNDYHPGGYQRHRGHYDYVPGHYDYHQTGHWDR